MTCEEIYKKIEQRPDMSDIPIRYLIRAVVAAFEEITNIRQEEFTHVDDI